MKHKHKEDASTLIYILMFLRNISGDSSFVYIDLCNGKLKQMSMNVCF